jgi:hypothetical protein
MPVAAGKMPARHFKKETGYSLKKLLELIREISLPCSSMITRE